MQPGNMDNMQPGRMGDIQTGDAEGRSFPGQEGASDAGGPPPPDGKMENPPQRNENRSFARPGHSGSESGSTDGTTESNSEETYFDRTDRPGGPGEQMNDYSPDAEPASSTVQAVSNGTALNGLSSTVWLLLGASVFVLATAIVFAIHYRKY